MMTPSSPIASAASNAYERTNVQQAANVDASTRAAYRTEHRLAVAHEANVNADVARAAAAARQAAQVPDVMDSLSTVAVVGALASVPAALNMMREIALASASGTLSDADRRTLQDDYAQLSQKVVTSVGAVGSPHESTAGHDSQRDDNAENTFKHDSDDHRSTLTRTVETPVQAPVREPVEHTVTTQRSTLVADGHASQKDPQVNFHTHELHVGADSYEPVSTRQAMTRTTLPETFGRYETHAETQHVHVAQAAQVTQFTQVAQTEHIAPLSAVA